MNTNLIAEDILRIKNIFEYNGVNIPETDLLIESRLLLEQGWPESAERILTFLDKNLERALDRYLPKAEGGIERRLNNYIYDAIGKGKSGVDSLASLCKFAAENNSKYAEDFATTWEAKIERLAKTKKTKNEGLAVIEKYFGSNIRKEFERLKPNWFDDIPPVPPVNPTPPPPVNTLPVPFELGEGSIKKFQTWLNKRYPGWNGGKTMDPSDPLFGKWTNDMNALWTLHKKQFLKQTGHKVESLFDALDFVTKKENWDRLTPREMTIWEKFMATPYFNIIAPKITHILNLAFKEFQVKRTTYNKVMEDAIEKLKYASENFRGIKKPQLYFRDINTQLMSLKQSGDFLEWGAVYKKIETILDRNGVARDEKEVIMKAFKENNPWDRSAHYSSKQENPILKTFFESSMWRSWAENFESKPYKEKLIQFGRRLNCMGIWGSVKTGKEASYFIEKYGALKGGGILWIVMTLVTKLGMPLFSSFMETCYLAAYNDSLANGERVDYGDFGEVWMDIFESKYVEMYNNDGVIASLGFDGGGGAAINGILTTVIPVHSFYLEWSKEIYYSMTGGIRGQYDAPRNFFEKILGWGKSKYVRTKNKAKEIFQNNPQNFYYFLAKRKPPLAPLGGKLALPSEFWISKEKSENGKEFGIDEKKQNWIFNVSGSTFVKCGDCKVKQNVTPPPTATTASTETVYVNPSQDYSSWENFVKNNKLNNQSTISDTSYGIFRADGIPYEYCEIKKTYLKSNEYEANCKKSE